MRRGEKWFYKGTQVDVVAQYKYLGMMFTSKIHASWSVAQSVLAAQAKKALFVLKKCQYKTGTLSFNVAVKLFNASIVPICLYGSEVWGYDESEKCEGVLLEFVKQKICVRYWLRLLSMPRTRYPKV